MKRILYFALLLALSFQALEGRRRFSPHSVAAALPTIVAAAKNSASTTTVNVTVSPTAGYAMVVACGSGGGGNVSSHAVSDNIDGTTGWVAAQRDANSTGTKSSIWYKLSMPAGVTTITFNSGAGPTSVTCICHVVQNVTGFTGGEISTASFTSASTNFTTPAITNGTANSIYFAMATFGDLGPMTATINQTGTTGTWNLYDVTNSQETGGGTKLCLNVANIVVSSGASRGHGWTNGNDSGTTCSLVLH